MMTGIWRDAARYQAYFRFRDWFLTGDMVTMDEDGYYFHQGRNDDLIKLDEKFVGPYEVEQVLSLHPAVAEAVVISLGSTSGRACVKGYVTLGPGFTASARLNHEIKAFVKANLNPELPLKEIEFMEAGEVHEFWIDLWSTSIVFNEGHRIGLAVTSSNCPRYDPNPNTGSPFRSDNDTVVAHNTIYHGTAHPSRIVLPLAGPDADGDGRYDVLDFMPELDCSEGEVAEMIGGAELLVASLGDGELGSMLTGLLDEAKSQLAGGDLATSAHLARVVNSSAPYDPSAISLAEAMEVIQGAMELASASAGDSRPTHMAHFVRTGWILADLLETSGETRNQVLEGWLYEAEGYMQEGDWGRAEMLADWLDREDVFGVVYGIDSAREKGLPERDIRVIESFIQRAKENLMKWDLEQSESSLSRAGERLLQMGIEIPEVTCSMSWVIFLFIFWNWYRPSGGQGFGKIGRCRPATR